jgi:hypothetical protein
MNMDNEKLQGIIERLMGIEQFAKETREMLENDTPVGKNDVDEAPTEAPEEQEEDEEITQEDIDAVVEEYGLANMKIGELRDLLNENEVEYPEKAKKAELINLIATAILDGTIPTEEEDEDGSDSDDGEDDGEETDDVSEEDDSDNDEESEPEDREEVEVSPERAKAEEKLLKSIDKEIKSGKLTGKKMKDFLKKYFEGDPDCAEGCKGCNAEDIEECYKDAKLAFVDDEGELNDVKNPYLRNDVYFCCGKECKEVDGSIVCEVCGQEYELED